MKLFLKSLVVILSLLSFDLLGAQNPLAQAPSPSPSPTTPTPSTSPIAIKAGRLLDVKTGKIANNVYISIENHRINSIATTPPQGVQIIDLSNSFVMPGMVDCHAHILGDLADLSPGSSFQIGR